MKRLIMNMGKNSPGEYNRIFSVRAKKEVDEFDLRRWVALLKYFKGGRLVDMGCLDSLVPMLAHKKRPRAELWGIDLAAGAVKQMRQRFPYVYYETRDVYKTDFPAEYFDYVVAGELIEHLDDPGEFIAEAMRVLKPKGVLAISTPLDEAQELGAVDRDRHIWSFTENDLIELLKPYGKVETKILRSQQFPVYRYCWPQLIAFCTKK